MADERKHRPVTGHVIQRVTEPECSRELDIIQPASPSKNRACQAADVWRTATVPRGLMMSVDLHKVKGFSWQPPEDIAAWLIAETRGGKKDHYLCTF